MDEKPGSKGEKPEYPYPEDNTPKRPMKERWANYQPNKHSMYKAVGFTVLLTVALGFTLGGWYTSGGAQDLARESRLDYAAQICAEKFMAADASGQKLAELKSVVGHHQRRDALEDGDWVLSTGNVSDEFIKEVNFRCSERLVNAGTADSGMMAESNTD